MPDATVTGLDLHSRNTCIVIMDKEFDRVLGKRVPNKLPLIFDVLEPFQNQLDRGYRHSPPPHSLSFDVSPWTPGGFPGTGSGGFRPVLTQILVVRVISLL